MEPLAIAATALAGLKTASELARSLSKKLSSLKDGALRQEVLDLYDSILASKGHIDELSDAIREKESAIAELQEKLKIHDKVVYEPPVVWMKTDASREGPYCHVCWEKDEKLIHLRVEDDGTYYCHVCNNTFYGSHWHPRGDRARSWDPRRE